MSIKIDKESEKIITSYIRALASSGPGNWKGFYNKKSTLFKWPLHNPVRDFEFKEQVVAGTREHFKRETDKEREKAEITNRLTLYSSDIAYDLEKIWFRDLEKSPFNYGAIINGLYGYLDNQMVVDPRKKAKKAKKAKKLAKEQVKEIQQNYQQLVAEGKMEADEAEAAIAAAEMACLDICSNETHEGVPCLMTDEARQIIVENIKKVFTEREADINMMKKNVIMLHPEKYTMSLWNIKNLLPNQSTREFKECVMKSVAELDVQVDALTAMTGQTRQLDLIRVLVLPMTTFNDKNLIQAMKQLKLEKDDSKKLIINQMKEHETHKGVWSIRLNRYNSCKKYNLNPSKLTPEVHFIVLAKEAIKRLRTPAILNDYAKPVLPISSAKRQLISPDLYKQILGILLSLAQQTTLFTFADYVKGWNKFRKGFKDTKIYNVPEIFTGDLEKDKLLNKERRLDYVPERLKNAERAKVALSEEQKKAIGLSSRGHAQHKYTFIYGLRGTGKSTCLRIRLLERLRLCPDEACVYVNLRDEECDEKISSDFLNHPRFHHLKLNKNNEQLFTNLNKPILPDPEKGIPNQVGLGELKNLQDILSRNNYSEMLGYLPNTDLDYTSINKVNYYIDNFDSDLDDYLFFNHILVKILALEETNQVIMTSRVDQKFSIDTGFYENLKSCQFKNFALEHRVRGNIQINQLYNEITANEVLATSSAYSKTAIANYKNIDTHTMLCQDIEFIPYEVQDRGSKNRSCVEIANDLLILILDTKRSFGATATAKDILVTFIAPQCIEKSKFERQIEMVKNQCKFENVAFLDLTDQGKYNQKSNQNSDYSKNPTTEGKLKSEYPIVMCVVFAENLVECREGNKPIVGKLWILQALEESVGRAMGHLIIIGNDKLLKETRHAIYPNEYMDKGVGVKFGRALAMGLGK